MTTPLLTNAGSTYQWRRLRAAILLTRSRAMRLLRRPGHHRRPQDSTKPRRDRPPRKSGSSLSSLQPVEGCKTAHRKHQ